MYSQIEISPKFFITRKKYQHQRAETQKKSFISLKNGGCIHLLPFNLSKGFLPIQGTFCWITGSCQSVDCVIDGPTSGVPRSYMRHP